MLNDIANSGWFKLFAYVIWAQIKELEEWIKKKPKQHKQMRMKKGKLAELRRELREFIDANFVELSAISASVIRSRPCTAYRKSSRRSACHLTGRPRARTDKR